MNKIDAIPNSLKSGIILPLTQKALTLAGALTQISVGAIPGITPLPELSENFCRRTKIITEISEEDKKLLQNFKTGIILANHPNKIMVDFPAWMRYLDQSKETPVRIGTGLSVTPMYSKLLPDNCDSFLAQLTPDRKKEDLNEVQTGIQDSIDFVKDKTGILILPYKEQLGATHRRILEGVGDETNIIDIISTFPNTIGYTKGESGVFLGSDSMYGRIYKDFPELDVKVLIEKKSKEQLGNR